MKYYPAIFVLEPFHKEFLISLLIGKFLYLLQLILKHISCKWNLQKSKYC